MSTSMYTRLAAATAPTDKTIRVSRNKLYPIQAWYCIALFLFIVGIFQWSSFLRAKFARKRPGSDGDEEQASSPPGRISSLRRIPVALANVYRVVAFRWTLDVGESYTLNTAEIFITVAYIIFLYIWAFINTTDLEGQKFDLKYWCNRAGTLATSQFPLITALGTKNNLVTLVTGISYDKLNYIHRMTARVVLILLWVHTGGEIADKPLQPILNETWLQCGFVGVIALTVLCIISVRPIRAAAYEVFFYAHFALILIFLVCSYVHTEYDSMTYWVYPCFVIWGLDRLIRVIRLVLFNHLYFGPHSGSKMDAIVELLSEDVVRLHFHRPPHFHWSPGQTAYLIMPTVSRIPFEAHPFTIASYDSNLFEEKTVLSKSNTAGLAEHALASSVPFWKEVVFFVNVRGGFTARLKEAALNGKKVKVLLDGPYGPTPNLASYNTSILIAGGSGVSYTLPAFLDIIERVRNNKSDCHRVVFIWSIRDANHMQWIDDTLIRAVQLAPPSLSISIRIHVTGVPATIESLPRLRSSEKDSDPQAISNVSQSDITESELGNGKPEEKSKESLLAIESVKVEHGRPDLGAILGEEVQCASGRMSVSVCGSQAIARSVRRALRFPVSSPRDVLNGGPSVTLHVESFGYA